MSYPTVQYYSNGSVVNVIINNGSDTTQYLKTDQIDEVLNLCQAYSEFGHQDDINDLLDILEDRKVVVDEENGILKDSSGYYFEGIEQHPIPDQLLHLIEQYQDQGLSIDPLKNFYHWLLLNPNQQAQEDLLQYIEDYGIVLTSNGYMMLYKGVIEVDSMDTDLAKFVSTEFIDIISNGESSSDYAVYENPNWEEYPSLDSPYFVWWNGEDVENAGYYEDVTYVGNLADLHNKISSGEVSNTPLYTDWYSETMNYTVGQVFSQPREECDPDISQGCSTGLHVGSYDYVSHFVSGWTNYAVFGCLVNPMNVVAVPTHDNSKIRTCEFKSLSLMKETDNGFKKVDNLVLSELEDEYLEEHMSTLDEEFGGQEVKDNLREIIQL